jgi:CHAT domain-containing protein/tetratricopeptide (TPR) repeat protein
MWLQRHSRVGSLAFSFVLASASGPAATDAFHRQTTARAVIVDEVARGSAGEQGGVRPGDLLHSWVREAAPPANPHDAHGELGSPFDLLDVEMEQAPRGEVRLSGTREGAPFSVVVPPGAWGISVRPYLREPILSVYERGKVLLVAGNNEGLAAWRELARQLKDHDGELAAWLFVKIGDTLAGARRWDDAHTAYAAAMDAAKARGTPVVLAALWDTEGMTFERQNEFARADAAYREALQIRERAAQETLALATSTIRLATIARSRGNLGTAEEFLKRSLALTEKLAPDSLAVALSLNGLGNVALDRGDIPRAEVLHQRALAIRERLVPDSLLVAATLNSLASAGWARGDLGRAEELYRRSLAIRERLAPGSLDVAATVNNLGNVANDRGDLLAAEELHKRSLAIREKVAPNSLEVATSLNNLGTVVEQRGDIAAAEEFFARALRIRERLAPDSLSVATSLSNLGNMAHSRGDLNAAVDFYKRALAIKEKLAPGTLTVALTLSNAGAVARDGGDLTGAEQLHTRALAIREKFARDSLLVAETLDSLGSVAYSRRDLPAAEGFFSRALRIRQTLAPDSLSVSESLMNLADVAKGRGDLAAAEASYKAALVLRQKLAAGSALEAESLYRIATLERAAARNQTAADYLEQATRALESQTARLGGSDEVRSGFAAQYGDYYREYIHVLLDLRRADEAFHVVERSRARSLLAMLAERDLGFAADLPADLARERTSQNAEFDRTLAAIARLNPAKDAAEIDRLLGRLRELRDKREAIAQAIRKASPRFASLLYPQPLDLAGAYCVTKDETFLFVVQPSVRPLVRAAPALSVFTLGIGELLLREKVAAFRSLIQRGPAATGPLLAAGQELFDMLIAPAQGVIAGSDRVVISPDGPLHTLPFAALVQRIERPAPGATRYLIEWKPLHVVNSATLYAEVQKTRRSRGGAHPRPELVAFGDPVYPPLPQEQAATIANPEIRAAVRRGYMLARLPASRTEVDRIARLYGDRAATYLGEQATEERAKGIGPDVRYLHFAGHGLLDERFPLNSALALTIPERPSEGQANGLLQAWEILEQMRIDADLVTLSACETGLGKELGGEGLVGLTRAFQYAGARTVLASLWSVGDDSTAELMTSLYRSLRAGKSKDEALRTAQIDLIRGRARNAASQDAATASFQHPFHWAAFQLMGDWR